MTDEEVDDKACLDSVKISYSSSSKTIEKVVQYDCTHYTTGYRQNRQHFPSTLCTDVPLTLLQEALIKEPSQYIDVLREVHCCMVLSSSGHGRLRGDCPLPQSMNLAVSSSWESLFNSPSDE
jgi:hypothetical protein